LAASAANICAAIAESGRKDIEVVGINDLARSRPTPICCARFVPGAPRHGDRRGDSDQLGNGKIRFRLNAIRQSCRGRNSAWAIALNAPWHLQRQGRRPSRI